MAHSNEFEMNVINFQNYKQRKATKLVQSLCTIKTIYLKDGTKDQMNRFLHERLLAFGIDERADQMVYKKSIRNAILLYCSIINESHLTIEQAATMVDICILAISIKNDAGSDQPFILGKDDIVAASNAWNEYFFGPK